MRQLGEDIWTLTLPLRLPGIGVNLGTRTTLVRLGDGGLWVHSPGPLDAAARAAIDALGPVRCLVAPNRFHHLYLADAAAHWPGARVFLARGLAGRHGVPVGAELGDEPDPAWSDTIAQVRVAGVPRLEEVVFVHRPSGTAILADLCFGSGQAPDLRSRLFLRLAGAHDRFGPSRMMRRMVRDPAALRASLDRVLACGVDRIVLAHGDCVESGGRRALADAWAWLRP